MRRIIRACLPKPKFNLKSLSNMGTEASNISNTQYNYPYSDCRIVVVGPKSGDDCLSELIHLPKDARIIATGENLDELIKDGNMFNEGNVLLNVSGDSEVLGPIVAQMPFLTWVHSITAGVDHLLCPEIVENDDILLTNAKGVFSSSLAEYVMLACSYFAKNLPKWLEQKEQSIWNKFLVNDLRGKTMGIVGYGNIGQACAKLAKAYGMNIIALRKNPIKSQGDKLIDKVYGLNEMEEIFSRSDFLVVTMALTKDNYKLIDKKFFSKSKKGMIFINIGRGAVINEDDLVEALSDGTIEGAALDVFTNEPLPKESPFWKLSNVLLSPHNADLTSDSRRKSVKFFTENCDLFLQGIEFDDCVVDKKSGY